MIQTDLTRVRRVNTLTSQITILKNTLDRLTKAVDNNASIEQIEALSKQVIQVDQRLISMIASLRQVD